MNAEMGCMDDSDDYNVVLRREKDKSPKPPLRYVLNEITSFGAWTPKSMPVLAACTRMRESDDPDIHAALSSMSLAPQTDVENVYYTLFALYILQCCYFDDEDEWRLIAGKASSWLRKAGVHQPNNLVKKFSLELKD